MSSSRVTEPIPFADARKALVAFCVCEGRGRLTAGARSADSRRALGAVPGVSELLVLLDVAVGVEVSVQLPLIQLVDLLLL